MRAPRSDPALPRLAIEHPRSLAAIVEARLRDAIVNAELAFGQALPEDGTGLALGVSRTPMREALMRLSAQGLVVLQPKRGASVFEPTVQDVRELAEFRLMLESHAVELCARSGGPEAVADLAAAYDAMAEARASKDGPAYARADTAFHDGFFAHCGNSYLVSAYATVSGRIAALRAHLSVPRVDEQATSFREHGEILDALREGRPGDATRVLVDHIMRAARVYETALGEAAAAPPAGPLERIRPAEV